MRSNQVKKYGVYTVDDDGVEFREYESGFIDVAIRTAAGIIEKAAASGPGVVVTHPDGGTPRGLPHPPESVAIQSDPACVFYVRMTDPQTGVGRDVFVWDANP